MEKADSRPFPGRGDCCVYLLRCKDGSLYCGWTDDLARRFGDHCRGRGARYTRGRGPLSLVYWEPVPSRSEALKRERRLKRLGKARKERLVQAFGRGREADKT